MLISETIEEFDFFKDKSNLIIVAKNDDSYYTFYGPPTKKVSGYPLYCVNIAMTHFKRYKKFNQGLEYAASEVKRQGQMPVYIAQLKLKFLKEKI